MFSRLPRQLASSYVPPTGGNDWALEGRRKGEKALSGFSLMLVLCQQQGMLLILVSSFSQQPQLS